MGLITEGLDESLLDSDVSACY